MLPYSTGFPVRLAVGLWLLMTDVFLNAYTSCVTSFLTAPKLKPIVNTFEGLAASDHMLSNPIDSDLSRQFLVRQKKTVYTSAVSIVYFHARGVKEATSEPFKSLGDSLRRNPFSTSLANLSAVLPGLIVQHDGVYAGVSRIH